MGGGKKKKPKSKPKSKPKGKPKKQQKVTAEGKQSHQRHGGSEIETTSLAHNETEATGRGVGQHEAKGSGGQEGGTRGTDTSHTHHETAGTRAQGAPGRAPSLSPARD